MRLDRKALYIKLRIIIWGVTGALEVGVESHDHICGQTSNFGWCLSPSRIQGRGELGGLEVLTRL